MVLKNFKSYAGVQKIGPFHKTRYFCLARMFLPWSHARPLLKCIRLNGKKEVKWPLYTQR